MRISTAKDKFPRGKAAKIPHITFSLEELIILEKEIGKPSDKQTRQLNRAITPRRLRRVQPNLSKMQRKSVDLVFSALLSGPNTTRRILEATREPETNVRRAIHQLQEKGRATSWIQPEKEIPRGRPRERDVETDRSSGRRPILHSLLRRVLKISAEKTASYLIVTGRIQAWMRSWKHFWDWASEHWDQLKVVFESELEQEFEVKAKISETKFPIETSEFVKRCVSLMRDLFIKMPYDASEEELLAVIPHKNDDLKIMTQSLERIPAELTTAVIACLLYGFLTPVKIQPATNGLPKAR